MDIMVQNVKSKNADKQIYSDVISLDFVRLILHLVIYLTVPKCIQSTPDVSQEGILKPFRSYKDITMFHYIVPKETIRATWQFAAFMDDNKCLPRKVHIYLRWGAFPIINQNDSLPENLNISHQNQYFVTTETAFETKSMIILPIYSPLSGDWFVGAHLTYWDKHVYQQGLNHKCQYSLGSVASWSPAKDIQNVLVGYVNTMRTTGTESYYRIYIPSNVWNFHIYIWNCKFTIKKLHNSTSNCIRSIQVQGRTIPVLNHTHPGPSVNNTINGSYTFSEYAPYEDSYYYVLVVSDSIIEFNIKISTTECPVENAGSIYSRKSLEVYPIVDNSLHVGKYVSNNMKKLFNLNYTVDQPKIKSLNEFSSDEEFHLRNENCVPRFELARIERVHLFSRDYIIKGKDLVIVSDVSPTILQFNILPLIDVGGTLNIEVYLEADKQFSQQFIVVDICVQNGNVPLRTNGHVSCKDDGFQMLISSENKSNQILIPYPSADKWYASLKARCYIESSPVQCDLKKIPVYAKIGLRQCIYAGNNSCGSYGHCNIIQQGFLYYSSCECFGGYKGWACNDDTSVTFQTSSLLMTMLLTLSNIFFLPAIYIAIKRGFYAESLIYFSTMSFSILYHACDQEFVTYCIARYEVLQYSDFFSSNLSFWVTLVAMVEIPAQFVPLAHMSGAIVTAYCVQSDKTGIYSILILLSLGIFIFMCSQAKYCILWKTKQISKRFIDILIGLSLVILGTLLYCTFETEKNYFYVHSIWHVIIALSLVFLLPASQKVVISVNSTGSSDSVIVPKHNSKAVQSSITTVNSSSSNEVVTIVNI